MKPIGFFLLAICFGIAVPQKVSGNVETLLAEINRKPSEERLKILTEGAKREGVLYYYGATNLSDVQEIVKGFGKSYPFVDVRYT
jgi:hypothetical protein